MGRQKSWNNQAIAVCFELCKQHPTKTEPQTGIPRTTNYIKRKKSAMQPLHQENVPVKAKLGRRYFLYRKWQHFKLFQATEILLLLKQRETTALMWEPRTSLCSSSGGFPSPLQFQEIQPSPCGSRASHEATWGHQPAAAPGAHWKGSHGVISGILGFADFQKKLKEHPKCSYRENEEETDGMKELPKDSPSQWPQLFLNHFSFQNELFP